MFTPAGQLRRESNNSTALRVVACMIALSVAGPASRAWGQPEARPAPPAQIIPAGQIELARLVDLAAQQLGLNVEYDAAVLRGSATLRLDAGLSGEELWLLTNRVLASRGFTTVRMPGDAAYSVVRLADAPNLAPVTAEAGPSGGPPAGYVAVVVRTRHRAARDLVDPLSKVLSKPAGSVTALGESILLIGDLSHRIDPAVELLGVLDAPAVTAAVEEVALANLSGQQMATLPHQRRPLDSHADRPRPGHARRRRQLLQALRIHATHYVKVLYYRKAA